MSGSGLSIHDRDDTVCPDWVRYGGIAAITEEFRSRHAQAVSTIELSLSPTAPHSGVDHPDGPPDHGDANTDRDRCASSSAGSTTSPSGSPGWYVFSPTLPVTGLGLGVVPWWFTPPVSRSDQKPTASP